MPILDTCLHNVHILSTLKIEIFFYKSGAQLWVSSFAVTVKGMSDIAANNFSWKQLRRRAQMLFLSHLTLRILSELFLASACSRVGSDSADATAAGTHKPFIEKGCKKDWLIVSAGQSKPGIGMLPPRARFTRRAALSLSARLTAHTAVRCWN